MGKSLYLVYQHSGYTEAFVFVDSFQWGKVVIFSAGERHL